MSFADNWKKAAEGDGKIEPEPGDYTVIVDSAEGFYSKADKECVRVTLEIVKPPAAHPDLAGMTFDHMMFFGNEVGARISRENLSLYGIDVSKVADFDELIDVMDTIEGVEADVRVSVNGSYTNVNVQRSRTKQSDVPAATPGDFAPPVSANSDDPPPF